MGVLTNGVLTLMALKTVFARLIDLSSLLASNAFTACAAAVIALSMSEGEASEAFFSTQDLAWYALISFLAYEALAAALWGWRCYQIRKLLTEDGYKLFPRLNEKRWESIPDPVLLKRLRRAKLRKNVDMQTVCLTSSLMAAGMIAAMYLSNTGTTSVGWIASETAFAAYAVPSIALVCFLAMGIRLFFNGRKLEATAKQWISISSRSPRSKDIESGFVPGIVLCRSSAHVDKWGGHYRVIKITQIQKYLPPKSRKVEIEWAPIPL